MTSERPPEIEDRAVPGHREGDLITGALNQSAIATQHATDMDVNFCDPASPGSAARMKTTADCCQYFPKGTDLSVYGPEDLELVAQKLNGRPRKRSAGKPQPSVCVIYYY